MNDIQHLDDEALAELRDVMDDDFGILIETFLADSRERIDSLRKILAQGDADAMAKAAHSFKGSCINIGAPVLGQLSLEVEKAGRNGDLSKVGTVIDDIEAEFIVVARLLKDYVPQ